ncbi:unnamed protein product [Closterium sp. Naga37s-1]|nr:unnamed protein product [Closterium sp. Naga37s-1]
MVRVPGALVVGRQFIPPPGTQVEGITSGGATGYKGHGKKLGRFVELFVIEPGEASGSYLVAKQELYVQNFWSHVFSPGLVSGSSSSAFTAVSSSPPTTGSVVPLLLAPSLPFLASTLCSSVFASLVLRHPLFSRHLHRPLLSPLLRSLAPFTVSCVLSSLVTDPTAPPPPIFALVAAVADLASIRCLEYATKLVYEGQRDIQ